MRWSPFLSAAAAVGYISAVALFIHFIQSVRHNTPDSLLDGMGVMSLFVFSAAVMAFLFFYQPVLLLIENKKSEAISYFLKTLGIFGMVMLLILMLVVVQ